MAPKRRSLKSLQHQERLQGLTPSKFPLSCKDKSLHLSSVCSLLSFILISIQDLTDVHTAIAPGIAVSKDATFNSYSKQPAKRPRHRNDDLLLHSTSHRTLDYTARENKPKDGQPLLKHYIGVFDPATGDLQLVEAKKMVVRGAVRAQQATEDEMRAPSILEVLLSEFCRLLRLLDLLLTSYRPITTNEPSLAKHLVLKRQRRPWKLSRSMQSRLAKLLETLQQNSIPPISPSWPLSRT